MKRIIFSLIAGFAITFSTQAQAPEAFKYQAVVRDASNNILTNQSVGMRLEIQQGSVGGTAVYTETFAVSTNEFGLVNLEIGTGTSVDNFSLIDWTAGPYYLETAIDLSGGSTYSVMGTSQLMSVPYALYAKTSGSSIPGPQGPPGADGADGQGGVSTAGNGIIISGTGTSGDPYIISTGSACGLSIGDTHAGGIIFYLDASGCHGLVCAASDQSASIAWYNGSFSNTLAFDNGVYTGAGNMARIIYNQGLGSYAATLCRDLVLNTYSDWYLPSEYELYLMYSNIGQGNILGLGNTGSFANSFYWSSTEHDLGNAYRLYFGNGFQEYNTKSGNAVVRAVRAF